jgi:hypothetical protein
MVVAPSPYKRRAMAHYGISIQLEAVILYQKDERPKCANLLSDAFSSTPRPAIMTALHPRPSLPIYPSYKRLCKSPYLHCAFGRSVSSTAMVTATYIYLRQPRQRAEMDDNREQILDTPILCTSQRNVRETRQVASLGPSASSNVTTRRST